MKRITAGQNEAEMLALRNEQVRNMNDAYALADRLAMQGNLRSAKAQLETAEKLRQSARRMGAKV